MATVTVQSMPDIKFSEEDGAVPNADISLFNISPLPAPPPSSSKRLTSVYFAANPLLKNRRSYRILEKRKQLEQAKAEQQEDQQQRRFSQPFAGNEPAAPITRARSFVKEGAQVHSRGDFTDRRRQLLAERRRFLIQNQIKRQLSLPIDASTKKAKKPAEQPQPHATEMRFTVDSEDSDSEDTRSLQSTELNIENGDNLPVLDIPKRPGLSKRRNTLIRTSSFSVRNANTLTRKAVGIISKALEGKREKQRAKLNPRGETPKDEKKQLARKYSMMWMSKTVESNRMDYQRDPEDITNSTPFTKFRRAARLVKSLIQVCRVCQDIVLDSVSSEDWYKKIESFIDSTEMLSKAQGPSKVRPFITFVQDSKSKELVRLQFDKSMFARERRADYLLTKEIRDYLKIPSFERTVDQENEVLMFMKRAVPQFNSYSLDAQRRIVQCMHYDIYERDRVITRQGLTADGVYFILSGTLIEKDGDRKDLREMKPGEMFGEEDIICGCPRRTTVITRSEVELVSIHRLDYRAIVHMADDSSHPKYLDICKHDIVFQHFPMKKLMENPGVWTLLSYKYGRLIVKDSNEMEWIYIIKSGEAKVLKQLTVGKIDLNERRRNIKAKKNLSDPHAFQRKMITFVSERDYLKSQYKRGEYRPGGQIGSAPSSYRSALSAPVSSQRHGHFKRIQSLPGTPYMTSTKPKSGLSSLRRENTKFGSQLSGLSDKQSEGEKPQEMPKDAPQNDAQEAADILKVESENEQVSPEHEDDHSIEEDVVETDNDEIKPRRRESRIKIVDEKRVAGSREKLHRHMSYIDTSSKCNVKLPSLENCGSRTSLFAEEKRSKMINVPPFVQLESLHAGKVFGLRSCLPPDERGPSASLISGGCEVLQVNKKFFMKHADEALIGLIRVQYKPYPTEDDLIDRLDNNFQWEEFKQNTVGDFLVRKGKMKEEELRNVTIELPGS